MNEPAHHQPEQHHLNQEPLAVQALAVRLTANLLGLTREQVMGQIRERAGVNPAMRVLPVAASEMNRSEEGAAGTDGPQDPEFLAQRDLIMAMTRVYAGSREWEVFVTEVVRMPVSMVQGVRYAVRNQAWAKAKDPLKSVRTMATRWHARQTGTEQRADTAAPAVMATA